MDGYHNRFEDFEALHAKGACGEKIALPAIENYIWKERECNFTAYKSQFKKHEGKPATFEK